MSIVAKCIPDQCHCLPTTETKSFINKCVKVVKMNSYLAPIAKYLHFVKPHQAYNVACCGSELQSDAATEAKVNWKKKS